MAAFRVLCKCKPAETGGDGLAASVMGMHLTGCAFTSDVRSSAAGMTTRASDMLGACQDESAGENRPTPDKSF